MDFRIFKTTKKTPFEFPEMDSYFGKWVTEDTLKYWDDVLTAEQKASAMMLSYQDILELKAIAEQRHNNELKALLSEPLIDRIEGEPFDIKSLFYLVEMPYKTSLAFKRALNAGKVSVGLCISLIEQIESEYKPLTAEEDSE